MSGITPIMVDIQRTATAAATYVIQAQVLEGPHLMCVQCVSYVNKDSNNKDLTWGFRVGSRDVWVHTIEGAGDDIYQTWTGAITLRTENRLIFKVISPAAGDRTKVTVFGYLYEDPEALVVVPL